MNTLPVFPDTAWRGIFARWRAIVEPITVTPLPYHFGNLLSVLSSQMGDMAVLDEGVRTFLNFYVFSYGRTGTKKSTAMRLVREHMIEHLKTLYFTNLSQISSAEGLIRTLNAGQHNVLLRYDEIKHLLSISQRSGSAIEPVLNDAFDLGDLQTVVRDEKASLVSQPYFFNLVANGTPIHITVDVGEAMFKGGLLNRFLVFAALPSGRRKAKMGVPDRALAIELAGMLDRHVAAWRGKFPTRGSVRIGMTPEADAIFDPWHDKLEGLIETSNELISDPIQRVSLYAKKLAGMYCLYETEVPEEEPKITGEQIRAAIDVAEYCQASIIFMSGAWSGSRSLGARSEALAEQRIEMYLQEHGCTGERELSRHLHMSIGETKRAVLNLASVDVVMTGHDRPPTIHLMGECRCFEPTEPAPGDTV